MSFPSGFRLAIFGAPCSATRAKTCLRACGEGGRAAWLHRDLPSGPRRAHPGARGQLAPVTSNRHCFTERGRSQRIFWRESKKQLHGKKDERKKLSQVGGLEVRSASHLLSLGSVLFSGAVGPR